MIYVSNAFSLQMVRREDLSRVRLVPIGGTPDVERMVSIVGHADTARLLGVAHNRVSVMLAQGDSLYVGQITGGRLPEGATTLPEGARIEWICVEIDSPAVSAGNQTNGG